MQNKKMTGSGVFWLPALFLLLVMVWGPAVGEPLRLKLLSYNTHGLPTLAAMALGDDPEGRFPAIARLTGGYDIVLLQEDFAHHDLLLRHLPGRGSVMRGEDSDDPPCFVCTGSGLTLITRLDETVWTKEVSFHAFGTCSGWLDKANDCFAQKGFQLVILTSSAGHRLLLVNTHLDAGDDGEDRAMRAKQLDQIATTLEQQAGDPAIIMAGDLNLDWNQAEDRALLEDFQARLGLRRAVNGAQADSGWRVLDYVLYRSGKGTEMSVSAAGEDQSFVQNGAPLSDHPALSVTFRIR